MSPKLKPSQKRFVCSNCGQVTQKHAFERDSGKPRCKACYVRDLSTPQAMPKKQAIMEALQEVEPSLTEETLRAAIEDVAGNIPGLDSLLCQLKRDADLFRGSSAATPLTYQLIMHLREVGAENLTLPICTSCGKEANLTHILEGDKSRRVCSACFQRNYRVGKCSRCHRERPCRMRSEEGQPLCVVCYRRDPRTWEDCSICGTSYMVGTRDRDGSAVCSRCYRRPKDLCSICAEFREINFRTDGRAVCKRCYQSPKRLCGGCGRMMPIDCRANDENPDLCQTCWKRAIAKCLRCGREDRCTGLRKGRPLCGRCRLADRLDDIISGDDGEIFEPLRPLKELILSAENPQTGYNWISSSPSVEVLKYIAREEVELSHEALDELPQVTSLIYLRELLMNSEVLPWRDPYLSRLERAIRDEAARIENMEDALALKTFGIWKVLRRTRSRYLSEEVGIGPIISARGDLYEVARFVRWLGQRGKSLATCSQADVDLWLADGKITRYCINGFISWAVERRIVPAEVKVPVPPRRDVVGLPVDLERHVLTARRLLHDKTIDLADRVVGALVVIYAQRLTRIARLTTNDVIIYEANTARSDLQIEPGKEEVFLCLGQEQVFMPEPLGGLLKKLKDQGGRRQSGLLRNTDGDRYWLFPGQYPGRPQHYATLRQRLNALGIEAQSSRNAALVQLASELPPAVVADMIGLDYTTAEKWSQIVQGKWISYAISKARDFRDVR